MSRWILGAIFAAAGLIASDAVSAQNTYSAYINSDGLTSTGCTVAYPGGTFTGADFRVQATVTPGVSPQVSSVTLAGCSGGIFGPGAPIAGGYPVGVNNGTAGSDVIEFSVQAFQIFGGQTSNAQLGFVAQDATGSDVLFTTNGLPGGGPIQIQFSFPIPALGLGALVLLGGLMLLAARRFGRGRLLARTLGISLLALSGIGLAANFVVDGQVGDWSGVPPVGTDPAGDPTNGSPAIDIRAAFVAIENNTVFFRLDIAELQNQPPTANPVAVTTNEDTPVTITLSGTDPEGAPLTFSIATNPTKGTLGPVTPATPTSATVVYTPNANANGSDSFTYVANDGQTNSAPATVSITITPVDDAPVAVNDAATVNEDSSNNPIDVLANDTDIDAGPKSVTSVTQPANGTVAITGGGTGVSYTPNANYCNAPPGTTPDTFTYTLTPGGSTATVSVTVTCIDDAPVAVADAATVNEDSGANAIDVLANDTDIDAGPKSVASVTQPANGTVVITGGGTGLTYTPNANYCNNPPGTALDTFTYTLTPGSSSTTVTVTVTCVDDPPTAVNDSATVTEDDPATAIPVLVNDTDIDAGPITIQSVTQPANGAVVITGGGTGLTYQPNPNYCNAPPGTTLDTFTYTLNGGSTATVTMTVTCVDDPATAVNDAATVTEDDPATAVPVLANDTDPDGGPTPTITSVTQPANGTVVITGGGTGLTYQPNANYCNNPPGTTLDTFTYTIGPVASTATVTMTVTCVDDAPVAVADAATVNEDSGANAIDVLANDTDIDAGPKSVASVTQPANGTVVITGGGTGLTYAPNADYCNNPPGTTLDSFTYTLAPGSSSTTVTVTVTCVDDPPVAVNDAATVNEDSGANAIDVLANDTDVDGGTKLVGSVTQPANGAVVITGGGTGLTYAPNANYCNNPPGTTPDTFTYTLNGGSTATVSVTVTCVDDAPTAVNDAATVNEDSGANAINVLANDTDPDGGPISITSVTQPANGTVVITGGGTGLTYAPNANYCNNPPGTTLDTFTYTLTPGGTTATVTVTVTCVDDPPVAVNDAATVLQGSGANPIDVLANDTDIDGGPKTVNSVTQPANGTVVITGGGTGVTYQPNVGYCNNPPGTTPDTFTYTLNGGSTATVSVLVTCDTPPTAVNDAATVVEDSGANAIDVLANDTDPDGGPKSVASVTQPANGTVVITGGGTGLTYQPNPNYCNNPPGTTLDTFTYTLTPGSSTATVTVTVTCVDDPPVAVDDSATVTEDDPATAVPVLTNDTDVDAGPKSIGSVTQPANGTVVITGGGTGLTYQPNPNYCNNPPGTTLDTFTYTLNGGSTATVTMTVTCVDDNTTAVNDAATVTEDDPATAIPVLANDTDPDGGPAPTIQSVTQPANGVVVITGGGTGLTYQPNANYCNNPPGTTLDTFTYTLTPGGSTATVTMTVTCVDDPPVAVDDAATVNEDSGATAIPVLTNDTDIDAGPKTVNSVTQPANGTVVITGGGTGLTYAPNANYCNTITGVPDTFTYTLNGGSTATVTMTVTCLNDPPAVASPPSYSVFTNIAINQPDDATNDLLGSARGISDVDSAGPFTIAAADLVPNRATTGGGVISIAADGSFAYNPPLNFTGADTVTYQVCDTGTPLPPACTTVTITFNVAGLAIVFVDDTAAAGGNGTLQAPLQTIAAGIAALASGGGSADIFLFSGAYPQTATQVMPNNLRIFGQGSLVADFDTLYAIAPPALSIARPALSGARPTVSSATVACLTLGQNNSLRGFEIDNCVTDALAGTSFGTLTVPSDNMLLNNTTGRALNLATGTTAATFVSVTSSGGATQGVSLNNITGTLTLGTGSLATNAGGTTFLGQGTLGTTSYAGTVSKTNAGKLITLSGAGATTSVTLSGNLTCNGGCTGLDVLNRNAGTYTFSAGTKTLNTGASPGVTLTSNAGATINFTGGGLDIDTTSGIGFSATGAGPAATTGGTVTVQTGANPNTIDSTTGIALNVVNTTIGAANLTFRSISANGASSGINLNNTGASGGLIVAGNGGACSSVATCTGGAIQNTTSHGIALASTQAPTFNQLIVTGSGGDGVNANGLAAGLTFNGCQIVDSGNGDNENGMTLFNVAGTVSIQGTTINNVAEEFIEIDSNNNSSMTLNIGTTAACTFTLPNTLAAIRAAGAFAGNGVLITARGSSNYNVNITNTAFTNIKLFGFQFGGDGTSAGNNNNITLNNNNFQVTIVNALGNPNNRANTINIQGRTTIDIDASITNNTLNGGGGGGIQLGADEFSNVSATITGNTVTNQFADGILIAVDQNATLTTLIDSNTITNTSSDGMEIANAISPGGVSTLNATITNNTVSNHNNNAGANSFFGGIVVFGGADAADVTFVNVTGNSVSGNPNPGVFFDYALDGSSFGDAITVQGPGVGPVAEADFLAAPPPQNTTTAPAGGRTFIGNSFYSNGATVPLPVFTP